MGKPPAQGPLDGNAIRSQRTRGRILAESLRLFNEQGEAQVTTGAIAAALGISPGNLYYHFRNKDAIIEELFAAFEERIALQPATAATGPEAIEDLWLYLHLMLEAVREYRFLYRGLDDLLARNRRLRRHFARIVERKSEAIEALCESLVRAGSMRAHPGELPALARNVLLVATFWPSFQALRHPEAPRAEDADAIVGQGAYQVMSLVAPYLVGDARRLLGRLGRSYVD